MKLQTDRKRQAGLSPSELAARTVHRRAVEAVIWGMPAVNYELMYQAGVRAAQGEFNQIIYWSRLPDWKIQTLTPNPDAIYLSPFINTKVVGPVVLDIPPADEGSITGTIMDLWQTPLEDVGPAGVDKGKGGKYLILPPGYNDELPKGYIALPSLSYEGYALLRSIPKSGSDSDVARAVAYGRRIKLYPLSQAARPPETIFVDVVDVVYDSTIPYDLRFFESLDRIVQAEPWLERDKAMIEQLKSIGIEQGKPFSPDARTQDTLEDAAREAHAWLVARYEASFSSAYYEGSHWALPVSHQLLEGQQTSFARPDLYPIDDRGVAYSFAYFCPYGRRFVLSAGDRGRRWPASRWCRELSPCGAGKRSGQAVLVGDRLRPRYACADTACAVAEPFVEYPRAAEECRWVGRYLLRAYSASRQGIQLGSYERRRRVRGALPLLRSAEAFVRQDMAVARYR